MSLPLPISSRPASPPEGESAPSENPFSAKVLDYAKNPRQRGAYFSEDATEKNLALITAKFKDIKVYWLVDPETDVIYDAKFFAYGGTLSIAVGEALSRFVKGLKVETACALTPAQVENLLRDEPGIPAFTVPADQALATVPPLLRQVLEAYGSSKALALATLQMRRAQNPDGKTIDLQSLTEADEAWFKKTKEEQLAAVEEVLDRDIRPGLNMDGGDLQVRDLEEGHRLLIRYQGACGSCGSSTGATLAFIEDTLRRHLNGRMQAVPVDY